MTPILFQTGGQIFRMLATPDDDNPHDKGRLQIDSLEVRTKDGTYIDVSGLIEFAWDSLICLPELDHAISRFCCDRAGERRGLSDDEVERRLFDRTEARAINGEAW